MLQAVSDAYAATYGYEGSHPYAHQRACADEDVHAQAAYVDSHAHADAHCNPNADAHANFGL